ncbi:hypothetical protein GLOIN_2v1474313 [Rhizophagus clarus]|uniref:Uncharacterized protein n=1 Tax=Rhizophagus clarus TaxID=94130 RepID=A0A8H3KX17_9GLOM|nr:hypothetical protein GLOIN_2v1474313 [Rhizophagus clarus]
MPKRCKICGANSTQHVESLNKKVHNSVKFTSSLLILVREIQQLLDNEANYVRIQKYKDEIPSVGLENIAKKYFTSIEKIVSDYLIAPMIIPIFLYLLLINLFIIKTYSEDDYNEGVREDHYETVKILFSDILATIMKFEIVKIWRIDNKITSNVIIQQAPISLCSNTSDNEIISDTNNFNLGHITKIKGAELYTLNLQELNNNHIKYGRAHGMMKKAIDLILSTNSYEEFIGICQDFLVSKQEILDNIQHQVKEVLNNNDMVNLIIMVRKGRLTGRMKSAVEIQDKEGRRNCLRSIDLNILKSGNKTQLDNKDNRKTCHNCEQKGYNYATCKFTG